MAVRSLTNIKHTFVRSYPEKRTRARICKRLRRPGIDSEDSIPPACVAWRAGTTHRVVVQARQAVIPGLLQRFTNTSSGVRSDTKQNCELPALFKTPVHHFFLKLRLVSNLSHRKSNYWFI
jgi:hypothetical protein